MTTTTHLDSNGVDDGATANAADVELKDHAALLMAVPQCYRVPSVPQPVFGKAIALSSGVEPEPETDVHSMDDCGECGGRCGDLACAGRQQLWSEREQTLWIEQVATGTRHRRRQRHLWLSILIQAA
jgi:hypothetical protein